MSFTMNIKKKTIIPHPYRAIVKDLAVQFVLHLRLPMPSARFSVHTNMTLLLNVWQGGKGLNCQVTLGLGFKSPLLPVTWGLLKAFRL